MSKRLALFNSQCAFRLKCNQQCVVSIVFSIVPYLIPLSVIVIKTPFSSEIDANKVKQCLKRDHFM
jgi:hypothetical protein